MAHLCVPQNQALGVCRGSVPDIQVCGSHGREDLVNATITSNAEDEEVEEEGEEEGRRRRRKKKEERRKKEEEEDKGEEGGGGGGRGGEGEGEGPSLRYNLQCGWT